jgi:acyl transferase domain-containing protein
MNAKDYGVLDAAGGGGERNEGAVDDIAVVGIGCRFPGKADGPDLLWRNLIEGRDCISEVPDERWHVSSFFNPRRGVVGKSASKWGGFIEGIDRFDAEFFGISPREAALMDPQQRMLLEICWEALEDAGCVPSHWHGRKVGVYVGGFTLDYMLMQLGAPEFRSVEPHTATGSMMTLLSNRLSYVFGFNGPSLSVDTACSSSLVAVHLACNSLRSGESELALAGGVSALLGPGYTVAESRAGMLSPTGRSRAFDSRADGYVRGEGAGLVVLKPLQRAVADGDHVYAVICATAVNQDGHSEGLTVPSGDAQKRLLREAYGRAGVAPGDIAYMEAHGTGTPVGDPIEANALGSVLSEGRDAGAPCFLGSIKTNIGHTEAAAGVAGLIKSALVLERRTVPPHLHLQQANPKIDFAQLRLQVAQQAAALPAAPATVHAGVNSFGFGGTNAHAVLRSHVQAHAGTASDPPTGAWVLPVSARDGAALRALTLAHAERLEQTDETTTDLCYTAATRREHHPLRLAAVGATRQELIDALRAAADQTPEPDSEHGTAAAGLAFVYTGMGPQWWGMGQALYRSEPAFRASVDRCAALFQARAGWSILEAMLADEQHSRMAATEVSQPANFIIQVALTDLVRHPACRDRRP